MFSKLLTILAKVNDKTKGGLLEFTSLFTLITTTILLYSNGYRHNIVPEDKLTFGLTIIDFIMNIVVNGILGMFLLAFIWCMYAFGKWGISLCNTFKEVAVEELEIDQSNKSKI